MLNCDCNVAILETIEAWEKYNSASFKDVIKKMFTNPIFLIYMYKEDLALNNLQWLICHKTQPNQAK